MLATIELAGALSLFLLSYWFFFSHGPTDVALAAPFDDVYPVLMMVPFLAMPCFIVVVQRARPPAIQATKLACIGTACTAFLIDAWIVATSSLFASRWTWDYNDLRELHYLVPWLNVIGTLAAACLFIVSCHEVLISRNVRESTGTTRMLPVVATLGIMMLGITGFGMIHDIMASQPLWVSVSTIAWVAVVECAIIMASRWHAYKGSKDEPPVDAGTVLATAPRRVAKPFNVYIFIGLLLWCVFVALYPAQLVFQEGPSNPWGTSIITGAAITFVLIVAWWRFTMSPLGSFLTVTVVAAMSPLVLAIGWATVPGVVPTAQPFSLVGLFSTLAWMLYNGCQHRTRWMSKHTLFAIWIWLLGFVIFFRDPLLEIWEMEEGLLKIGVFLGTTPDPHGTGVGLYYPVLLLLAVTGIACVAALLVLEKAVRTMKRNVSSSRTGDQLAPVDVPRHDAGPTVHRPRGQFRFPSRRQWHASLVILAIAVGCSAVLTAHNVSRDAPVVVAEMGNHGALWLANSYDRVLPDYRPNLAASPRDPAVRVQAMRGESELVQLVFSPLASNMISFQSYRWSSSDAAPGDMHWKLENGTLVDIPVRSGRVGYLNCFNPRIGDVLRPWEAFITGSGSRANLPFWLEIDVPRDVPAGEYTTSFEYVTQSYLQRIPRAASLKFTILLTVWNVTRPLNRTVDTVIGLYPESPGQADALHALARRYGVDPYSVGSPDVVYNPANLSAGISINWTAFDARVEAMFQDGMNQLKLDFYPGIDCRHHPEAVINGSKDNYLTLIRWFYGNASQHLANKLTPWNTTWESETITQHSDEPDPSKEPLALQAFKVLYSIIRNVSRIRSLQTFMYEPAFDVLLDCLDIWVLTPDSFSVEVARKIQAAGNEVWTYSNGDNFPGTDTDLRTPLIMSRLRGWVNYHYTITGFLHWVFYWNYNDAGRSGCGYDGRGDGTVIVPGPNGTYLPTLRLAAFRDGLEDNQLLWALNKTIARAGELSLTGPVVDGARATLAAVHAAMEAQPADAHWPLPVVTREFNHDAKLYMTLRVACGTALERLLALL